MSLLAVGSAADPAITRQATENGEHLAALLRDGRRHTPLGETLPDLIEEALIGAISGVVSGLAFELSPPRRECLRGELVQLVLAPYLGLEEAVRAAQGPVAPRPPLG